MEFVREQILIGLVKKFSEKIDFNFPGIHAHTLEMISLFAYIYTNIKTPSDFSIEV